MTCHPLRLVLALLAVVGCAAREAKPIAVRTIAPAERGAGEAMRGDAEQVVRLLADRMRAGEPLTPMFVSTYCAWTRRLCIAIVRLANDPQAGQAAADTYVTRMEDLCGKTDRWQGVDVNDGGPLPFLEARYHLREAELWAARLKAGGTLDPSDTPSAATAGERACIVALAAAAGEKLTVKDQYRRAGEPLTSRAVDEHALLRRQLAWCEISLADDAPARVAAAAGYVERARGEYDLHASLCNNTGEPRPQLYQSRYFLHEAEGWLARVGTDTDSTSAP